MANQFLSSLSLILAAVIYLYFAFVFKRKSPQEWIIKMILMIIGIGIGFLGVAIFVGAYPI